MFKKIKILFNNYFKDFTFLVFVALILLFSTFLVNVFKIENSMQNYIKYKDVIECMEMLNNNFNIFLSHKQTYVNYDKIEKKRKEFEKKLKIIDSKEFLDIYGNDNKKFIEEIKRRFAKKKDLLERYKSYNATIVSSVSYIFDMAKEIAKNSKNYLFVNEIYELFQQFLGISSDNQIIKKKIEDLIKDKRLLNDETTKTLYYNIKTTYKNIMILNRLIKEIKSIDLASAIKELDQNISQKYYKNIADLKLMVDVLFIVSIISLLLFLIRYIKHIKESKELSSFKYAVENSDNSIVITNTKREIVYINEAFKKTTGYSKEEVIGKNPNILKSGLVSEEVYKKMNRLLDQGKKWTGEFINRDKFGKIFYEKASITPMFQGKELIGYLAIKLNITNYIEQENKILFLAFHDELTKLKNRRAFNEEVEMLVQSFDKEFYMLFLDLDNFKYINDAFGHDAGDIFLQAISKKLTHNLSIKDTVFRIGGDEFAIILKQKIDEKGLLSIIDRIIKILNEPIFFKNLRLQAGGVSIGVVRFPRDGESLKDLIKNADIAMYKAKMDGKNRFAFFYEEFSKEIMYKLELEHELRDALKNNEFYVVYQPEYYPDTKKIVSFEALLRWNNKKLGLIPPSTFIPMAESLGLINEIGLYVFEKACEDFDFLKSYVKSLEMVCVNFSAIQLSDKNLVKKIDKIVKKYGLKPQNIGIEITETALMVNIEKNMLVLQELKDRGYKILIDDFGTGYSSLKYLSKLPFDILKIDKTFIDVLFEDHKDKEMIKAIITMSKNFGYKTIAEGIETKKQERYLKVLGVDLGQGFYFCKPLEKEKIAQKFS